MALDRLLTVRNTINLRTQNIFLVNSISLSYDNNIWLFDEEDFKLKIDEQENCYRKQPGGGFYSIPFLHL